MRSLLHVVDGRQVAHILRLLLVVHLLRLDCFEPFCDYLLLQLSMFCRLSILFMLLILQFLGELLDLPLLPLALSHQYLFQHDTDLFAPLLQASLKHLRLHHEFFLLLPLLFFLLSEHELALVVLLLLAHPCHEPSGPFFEYILMFLILQSIAV